MAALWAPSPAAVGEGWGGVACALAYCCTSPEFSLWQRPVSPLASLVPHPSPPLQAGEGTVFRDNREARLNWCHSPQPCSGFL
jgi:hypothetical protein